MIISASLLMIWYIISMCWFYATISFILTFYSKKNSTVIVLRICLFSCLFIRTIIDLWSWIPGESSNPDKKFGKRHNLRLGAFVIATCFTRRWLYFCPSQDRSVLLGNPPKFQRIPKSPVRDQVEKISIRQHILDETRKNFCVLCVAYLP